MELSKKAEQAKKRFESGCNCAQAVLGSFCEETGLSEETAMLVAAPFGGGIARTRETCGAVTGMLMVMGLANGYTPFTDQETHNREKARVYREGQALIRAFQEEFGSAICRELLQGVGADNTPIPAPRTGEYYKKRPCAECVAFAAGLAEAYLSQSNNRRTSD